MTSLFAKQFGRTGAYTTGPLDTGQPEVGASLPRGPKNRKQRDNNRTPTGTPAIVPEGGSAEAANAASAVASAASGAASNALAGISNIFGANDTVGAGSTVAAARQGTLNKLAHMSDPNGGGSTVATPVPNTTQTSISPQRFTGADPNIPAPSWGVKPTVTPQTYINRTATSPTSIDPSTIQQGPPAAPRASGGGGLWGDITHIGGDIANAARGAWGMANSPATPIVQTAKTLWGLGSAPMAPFDPTVARAPSIVDTQVTNPTRVFNPQSAISRGNSSKAIEANPIYSQQFKGSFGRDAAQYGQAVGDSMNWDAALKNLADDVRIAP